MTAQAIPFPTVRPLKPEYVGAVQREHASQVQALFAEALGVLRERMETANCIASAKLVLDACLPSKGRLVSIGGTSPAHIEAALAAGTITPAEARDMAQAVAACRSIDQLEALASEVMELRAAIEAMQ